jgi:hypothetical protein
MSDRRAYYLTCAVLWAAAFGTGVFLRRQHDLRARGGHAEHPPAAVPRITAALAPGSLSSTRAEVDAGSEGSSPPSSRAASATASAWVFLPPDLSEGFQPTAVGLQALTLDQWTQEGFATLPASQALLGLPGDLARGYDASWPGLLVDLTGLPTPDDCLAALGSEEVERLLTDVCIYDVTLAQRYAAGRGTRTWMRDTEEMEELRRRAAEGLMLALERETSFKHWRVLWAAFEEWSR